MEASSSQTRRRRFGLAAYDSAPEASAASSASPAGRDLMPIPEYHARYVMAHALAGKPPQPLDAAAHAVHLSRARLEVKPLLAVIDDAMIDDAEERAHIAAALMDKDEPELAAILNDTTSLDAQRVAFEGWLDRVRNAWRAIRGKPPKEKKGKKGKKEEKESTDMPVVGFAARREAAIARATATGTATPAPLAAYDDGFDFLLEENERARTRGRDLDVDEVDADADVTVDEDSLAFDASAEPLNGIVSWIRGKGMQFLSGKKPHAMRGFVSDAVAGSGAAGGSRWLTKADDLALAKFLNSNAEERPGALEDVIAIDGVKAADASEDRATGEVSLTIQQRKPTKKGDYTTVERFRQGVGVVKFHLEEERLHVNQLKVAGKGLQRRDFLDFGVDPGYVVGLDVRIDLSRHAGGQFPLKYSGPRVSVGDIAKDASMRSFVWVAPGTEITVALVFGGAGGVVNDELLYIFVLDHTRTKKERKKGILPSATGQLAIDRFARLFQQTLASPKRDAINTALYHLATTAGAPRPDLTYVLATAFTSSVLSLSPGDESEVTIAKPAAAATKPALTKDLEAALAALHGDLVANGSTYEYAKCLGRALGEALRTVGASAPRDAVSVAGRLLHAVDARGAGHGLNSSGDRVQSIVAAGTAGLDAIYGTNKLTRNV